jgi:hypothetical protein
MSLRGSVARHLQASCDTLDAPSTLEAMTCVPVIPPRVHQGGVKDSQIIFTSTSRPNMVTVVAQGDRCSRNVATLSFRQ